MVIKSIGVGGAFTEKLYHQCYMLSENGRNFFFDFGQQIFPHALKNAGLTANDVHEVMITHCHDDHIGSLGMLGLRKYDFVNKPRNWKDSKTNPPKLVIHESLLPEVIACTSGNFKTIEGFQSNLDTFFEVKTLKDNEHYSFEGWDFQMVQQVHVMAGSVLMNTFGLYGEKDGKSFFITSDTQYFQPRQVMSFYNKAQLVITDCETIGSNFLFDEGTLVFKNKEGKYEKWPEDEMKSLELMASGVNQEKWGVLKFLSGVHSTYPELAGYRSANSMMLSDEIKSKIWLSHYGDHVIDGKDAFGNPIDWDARAKKDGLAGFVKLGQKFIL